MGRAEQASIFVPETVVAAIRKRLKLSLAEFAERYGLYPLAIEDLQEPLVLPAALRYSIVTDFTRILDLLVQPLTIIPS
ncbi:hypothetical protein [Brucella intermedia]|uniref:hypothetical protein n=1 Tax=Brucella intermedia TaxID=94625 RepID=UPI00235F1615|nr:hypothetical protein [Brucella intermedia]